MGSPLTSFCRARLSCRTIGRCTQDKTEGDCSKAGSREAGGNAAFSAQDRGCSPANSDILTYASFRSIRQRGQGWSPLRWRIPRLGHQCRAESVVNQRSGPHGSRLVWSVGLEA